MTDTLRPSMTRRQWLAAACAAGLHACSRPPSQEPSRSDAPPNIVLYLSDTLRPDRLGCYGHGLNVSPSIDRLCAQSYSFDDCHAQGCWTKPSIASLITGVAPRVHQAVLSTWNFADFENQRVQMLRPNFPTVAEKLEAQGYATALFLSNPHVQKEFGFARGYTTYRYAGNEAAHAQMDAVLDWLAEAPEPYFLFVHQIDPHAPYTPPDDVYAALHGRTPADARSEFGPRDTDALRLFDAYFEPSNNGSIRKKDLIGWTAAGWAYVKSLYDAEIRTVDAAFGRLVKFLEDRGDWDRSLVAFTSDHGESFGEHDCVLHGNYVFNHETRVPLIMKLPGQRESARVPFTTPLLDVYATFLHAGGANVPSFVQSQRLFDANGALRIAEDRAAISEFSHYDEDLSLWAFACKRGRFKVICRDDERKTSVFDCVDDPGELNNLLNADTKTPEVEAALANVDAIRAECDALARAMGEPLWGTMDDATQQQLEALGYL